MHHHSIQNKKKEEMLKILEPFKYSAKLCFDSFNAIVEKGRLEFEVSTYFHYS